MDKYTELAKKIRQLALNGTAGEKENANRMLADFMKKHHIYREDLEDDKKYHCFFIVKREQAKLFTQIVYAVQGKSFDGVYVAKKFPTRRYVDATKAQEIEIRLRFDFYWKAYQEELSVFYRAFLQSNRIFPTDLQPDKLDEMTEEEKDILRRSTVMGLAMRPKEYIKQIEG